MDKKLEKIAEDAKEITSLTEAERANALACLADAESALEEAKAATADATEFDDYSEAVERERKARARIEFERKKAESLSKKQRMERARYDGHRAAIRASAESATEDFRRKAEAIGAELLAAYKTYEQTIGEINQVAEALDDAAGVLQAEYGEEWKKRALRYTPDKLETLYYDRTDMTKGADPVRVATWQLLQQLKGLDGTERMRAMLGL